MASYVKGRGPFYFKNKSDIVTIYLGNPDVIGAESEHVMTINVRFLKDIMSTIKLIEATQ